MIVGPPADVVVQMPGLQFGSVTWRFGFLGLMAGATLLPILGAFLWLVTARVYDHRWMARLTGTGAALAALIMLVVLALFALDAVQVRGQVRPEVIRRFDAPVIKSIATQLISIAALALISFSSFKGRSRKRVREERDSSPSGDGVLLGHGAS